MVVQPGEQKVLGRHYCGISILKESLLKSCENIILVVSLVIGQELRFQRKEGRFRQYIIKTFFTMKMVKHWMPHP